LTRRADWAVFSLVALAAGAPANEAVNPVEVPASAEISPLQQASGLGFRPGLDEPGRDALRREYRLAEAVSEQNASLNALFDRIHGTEATITRLIAQVEEERRSAVAIPAAAMDLPAENKPQAISQEERTGWLVALGASAVMAGLLYRRRRARASTWSQSTEMHQPDPIQIEVVVSQEQPVLQVAEPLAERTVVLPMPLIPHRGEAGSDAETTLDLAEILLHHGSKKGAMLALRDFLAENPSVSVRPWLKLLDVYRQAGMRPEFNEAGKQVHLHFNVRIPDWDEGVSGERLRAFFEEEEPDLAAVGLEHLPHIVGKIQESWGTPACLHYLRDLLADNRAGGRGGFPVSVVSEILVLQDILECRLSGET
jgi:hypothetical protein